MRLNLINFLILASIAVALFARSNAFDEGSCSFTYREDAPVAYFVNLKSERSRRMYMHRTLSRMNLDFHRIPAITPADIYIPPDLNNTWQTDACIFETKWEPSHSSHLRNFDSGFRAPLYVSSLCAKPRFLTEIACTASHLCKICQCHQFEYIPRDPCSFILSFNIFCFSVLIFELHSGYLSSMSFYDCKI